MDRSKWEYKKLGDIALVSAGQGAPQGENNYSPDGTPFVKAGNIESLVNGLSEYDIQKVNDEVVKSHRLKLYKAGSVLFAKSGMSCMKGLIYTLKNDCYVVSHLAIVTPKDINSHYLNYYFQVHKPNLLIKDSAYPSISLKDIENMDILCPSQTDQQRIVAELDCLNEMIAVKQEQLKEFDKLAQSIFYNMFGDDGGFEKVKLGDVVEVVSGLVDPNIEPYCSQLHVSPANIVSGTNEIVNCVKAKDEGLISDKYPFKTGMVLYSKIRPNLNKVAVANFDGICSADMYPLTVLPKANNVYITKLLSSKQFLEYAIKNSGRARMPKLNRETLFSYSFKLPPLSLQQQFAEKISAIEAQKELVKQSIAETQHLLDYTMDKYFG